MRTKEKIIKLKNEFKVEEKDKKRIIELDEMFFKDNHAFLRGKNIPNKIKKEIEDLWFKYGYKYANLSWNTDLLRIELKDLKSDPFCGKNTNKKHWAMCYILSSIASLKDVLTAEILYCSLSSREYYRIILKHSYEIVS